MTEVPFKYNIWYFDGSFKGGFVYRLRFLFSILSFLIPISLYSQDNLYVAPDVDIISVSPVQGSGIRLDRVPSNIQTISESDLSDKKNLSITDTLNKKAAGLSISNLNSSPMQNDINFRGYVAGPLLGTAQALAIYQNGMRVNESFGEVVQWDLVPDFAIQSMQLFPGGDPVFGQNAIGGAISMQMKNGFDFQGGNIQASGGTHSRTNEILEYGKSFGNYAVYFGANYNYDKGFRDHSVSSLETFYSDIRYRDDNTELFANIGQAYTDLNGNGAAPLSLMDLEGRDAVYTHPDNTRNKNYYSNFGGNHFVNNNLSLQGNMFFRHMERRNYNGDEFEGKDCGDNFDGTGTVDNLLCGEFEDNTTGVKILDISGAQINYAILGLEKSTDENNEVEDIGAINRSNTKTNAFGVNLQSTYDSDLLEKNNTFISGLSYDFSHNSFGSSTELAILQNDRGVQGTGVLLSTDEDGEEQFVTNLEAKTHNIGLYGSNTIDLNSTTSLNLSARWNWASLKMNDQHGTALDGHHFFNRINPGIGLTKRFDGLNTFISYKESSRTPSVAELACADPASPCRLPNSFQADPPLDQVVNRNIEIGARGNNTFQFNKIDHSVDWSVNAFAGRNYNDIIFIGGNRVGTGYFRNVGNTQRVGTEFALNGNVGDQWSWFAKYGYVHAIFKTSQNISSVGHPSNPFDDDDSVASASAYEKYQIHMKPGDNIPGISPHIARFGIGHKPSSNWNLGLDFEYNSRQFYRGDESNNSGLYVPSYLLTNVSIDYYVEQDAYKSFVFFFEARNIFDVNYETGGILAENEVDGTGGSGTFVAPGQPLTMFSGVRIRF